MFSVKKERMEDSYERVQLCFELASNLNKSNDLEHEYKKICNILYNAFKNAETQYQNGYWYKQIKIQSGDSLIYFSSGLVKIISNSYCQDDKCYKLNINDEKSLSINNDFVVLKKYEHDSVPEENLQELESIKNKILKDKIKQEEKRRKSKIKTNDKKFDISKRSTCPLVLYWIFKNENITNISTLHKKCLFNKKPIYEVINMLQEAIKVNKIQNENGLSRNDVFESDEYRISSMIVSSFSDAINIRELLHFICRFAFISNNNNLNEVIKFIETEQNNRFRNDNWLSEGLKFRCLGVQQPSIWYSSYNNIVFCNETLNTLNETYDNFKKECEINEFLREPAIKFGLIEDNDKSKLA